MSPWIPPLAKVRETLQSIKLTGKAAQVARQLLSVQSSSERAGLKTALLEGVEARLRRAQAC